MIARTLDAVLFDLDGTLLDSIELIRLSFRHAIEVHGKPGLEEERWLAGVGTPLSAQFAPFAADAAELDALIATYRAWNLEHHDGLVSAFPGAIDGLDALASAGLRLGIVTSKAHASARRGLDVAGFGERFEVLVAADDVERHKPDPTPVRAALEQLGVDAGRACYVGDSPHDLVAGRGAGAATAAAGWGPFPREVLLAEFPDVVLERPVDIGTLASR